MMQDENRSKEQLLEDSERRLNEAQHIAKIGSWDMNAQTGEGYWSDEMFHLFGHNPSEKRASYGLFREHIHPDDINKFEESITDYTARVKKVDEVFRYLTTKGEIRYAHSIGNVEFNEKGNPQRVFGTFQDVTERKQAEEKLIESERKHRAILEGLDDVAYRLTIPDGKYEYISQSAKSVFGYDRDDFIKNPLLFQKIIHPESIHYFREKWVDLKKGIVPRTFEYRIIDSEGSERWICQSISAITDEQGAICAIEGLCRDITDQKKTEKQIKASLEEKETLLHEIHHRVKNNMQIIASLLDMQLTRKNKQTIDTIVNECKGRVYAMAGIHESLHRSESLSEVDFMAYVIHLTGMLSQTYGMNPEKVRFDIKVPGLKLGIDKANPLGLVLNELISNSLKYAFPGDQAGVISIETKKHNENNIILTIADDGIGMPDVHKWKKTNTLGLRLVRDLVEKQINGSIDCESQNGTKYIINFNLESAYTL